jgi:hypothetical protein
MKEGRKHMKVIREGSNVKINKEGREAIKEGRKG